VASVYADLANKPAEQWIRNMQGNLQNQRLGIDNEALALETSAKCSKTNRRVRECF
jgi:hypothetical protein